MFLCLNFYIPHVWIFRYFQKFFDFIYSRVFVNFWICPTFNYSNLIFSTKCVLTSKVRGAQIAVAIKFYLNSDHFDFDRQHLSPTVDIVYLMCKEFVLENRKLQIYWNRYLLDTITKMTGETPEVRSHKRRREEREEEKKRRKRRKIMENHGP